MQTKIETFKDKIRSLDKPIRLVDYICAAAKLRVRDTQGVEVISEMLEKREVHSDDLAESLQRHLGLL